MIQNVKRWIKRNYTGYLYIAPVMIGILFFTLYPLIYCVYYSLFDYNGMTPPQNFGLHNYIRAFSNESFLLAAKNTLVYNVISIPMCMCLSFMLAMFLNQNLRGMKLIRTLIYLPVILPAVVAGLLWRDITYPKVGIGNLIATWFGADGYPFFSSADTAMTSFILLNLFTLGGGMVLWIAQLKNVPESLYESADLEGCGFFRKTFTITIPMCSPMIFYNLITSIIGGLQIFQQVYVLTGGKTGPQNSLLFYVSNAYYTAFGGSYEMGYALAQSWILFMVIGILTLIIFKKSRWVFYGEEQ